MRLEKIEDFDGNDARITVSWWSFLRWRRVSGSLIGNCTVWQWQPSGDRAGTSTEMWCSDRWSQWKRDVTTEQAGEKRTMTEIANEPIRYLGDVQRLVLNPGDTVVLSYDGSLPDEIAGRLREQASGILGPDIKVMVLGDGFKIGVLAAKE